MSKISERYENTCVWLLENEDFKSWSLGKGSNIFWLHGYPGLGKSVFAKFLVQSSLEREPDSNLENSLVSRGRSDGALPLISYFFCSNDDDQTTSPRNLLCSIIHQLLFEDPELAEPVSSKWMVIDSTITDSMWNLWKVLSLIISGIRHRPLVMIIDAVDELKRKSWTGFLDELHKVLTFEGCRVKLFVTSRTEPEIEEKIMSWKPAHYSLDDSKKNKGDVSSFINGTVINYAQQNSFDDVISGTICRELISRADGMFLWARLAWGHFTDGVGSWTRAILRERLSALQRLPPGLDSLYYRILMTVDERLHAELLDVLRWIATAKRPLTIPELSVALALKDKPKKYDDMDARISIREFLKRRCPHLLRVDGETITVVHQSFKNFLFQTREISTDQHRALNKFFIDVAEEERKIGVDCLTYLGLEDFIQMGSAAYQKGRLGLITIKEDIMTSYPFLEYAARHWPAHLSSRDDAQDVWHIFKQIVDNPTNYRFLCACYGTYDYFNPPIFTAFRLGLDSLVKKLVEDGHDINDKDGNDNHILHENNRHFGVPQSLGMQRRSVGLSSSDVNFLLELGADINGRDRFNQTVLIRTTAALKDGSIEAVRELLARPRVDLNAQDHLGVTALHVAVLLDWTTSDPLLDIMLSETQLELNIQDSVGRTPLTRAIHWGKELATKKLLRHPGVDISEAVIHGESPLINAACQGWTDIVIPLLRSLPSVDGFCDATGQTIFHWTVKMGMLRALKIAISKQSTVIDSTDIRGMTALHYAAQEGEFEATLVLLNHGAQATAKNIFHETPLHLAALRGHQRVLQVLLQHASGMILNERDVMGWTVIHRVIVSGNDDLVKYLVGRGDVDLKKKDRHGRTALAYAAAYASETTLKTILRRSDIGVDGFGNTLLHLAVGASNEATIPYLLCHHETFGRDLNRLNRWGKTALDLAPQTSKLLPSLVAAGMKHSESWARRTAHCLYNPSSSDSVHYHFDWKLVQSHYYEAVSQDPDSSH
jgi:ankyrin repeat protein